MINLDEDALICDLAETYHVLDYRALPPRLVAVLASGLPDNSRIKKKISGKTLSLTDFFVASILDGVRVLVWSKTKDAEKGRNFPKSVVEMYESPKKSDYQAFDSIEDFERRRAEILGR